eukprot:CAMPEP_0202451844 /NCGR_PEP_ID=MMETSP1360-20130828/10185_1 /ASSEMBLY_ACC=CAM_ASM_000848 /TAXON_ID=515479 /ORGANISM="Licmophora paradoxa, Strain CCMP2313" /LENGTH=77 /DNA_ID=CAMNT_0049070509 /DNA_START=1362 /DNA_END=1595 /DNA_ORIENTATION=-
MGDCVTGVRVVGSRVGPPSSVGWDVEGIFDGGLAVGLVVAVGCDVTVGKLLGKADVLGRGVGLMEGICVMDGTVDGV